jgi:hypothetical protein
MGAIHTSRFLLACRCRYPVDTGLLWYDGSKADFATKVLEAKERYEEKFGRKPNCCYVHPECLPEKGLPANGIKVVASPTVLPNHFWVGVEQKEVCGTRDRAKFV